MHKMFLKKYYFINKFDPDHISKLSKNISIIYRNYSMKNDEKLILKIKQFCKQKNIRFFLSNNLKLALKLNLDGVYIPSFNRDIRFRAFTLKKKFLIIGSAHNLVEIREKEFQKVKELFVASLFKKNQNYLGINKFNILSKYIKMKKVALGGINKNNINKLNLLNVTGFAGISFFE